MKKTVIFWLFMVFSSIGLRSFAATTITAIDFNSSESPAKLVIKGSGPIEYETQQLEEDKQVVIEIKNSKLANKSLAKKIDTSSIDGNIIQITPSQVNETKSVRIFLQLREMKLPDIQAEGNTLAVVLGSQSEPLAPEPDPLAEIAPPPPAKAVQNTDVSLKADAKKPEDRLEQFMERRDTKRFIGKRITVQLRESDTSDVFRLIGDASGFNIIVSDDVKGKVTLSLTDVPWDLALDTVLTTLRLGAERNNNVLRITTLANLTTEKQELLRAQKATEASAPRVTRVFPISYAKLEDLQATVSKFTSSAQGGTEGGGQAIVQIDTRTNSIIVRDIPENIDRIKKLIEILDTQTPQVMIEAKVIEANESFQRTLNGSLGASRGASKTNGQFLASFAGANPGDALIGSPGVFADGNAVGQNLSSNGGGIGVSLFNPLKNIINGEHRLNAILSFSESENEVRVVSAPKTVVINKTKAKIVQGTPVFVPTTTVVPGVGPVPGQTVQNANLSLEVTPTVTNEGSILMELSISRDVPFRSGNNTGVANRNITTSVVVDSGATLIIGGIQSKSNTVVEGGFPLLRHIPIIGWFFGNKSSNTEKSELYIFITPRILNEKAAGLVSFLENLFLKKPISIGKSPKKVGGSG